ncbi:hypothetical protein Y1Q_0012950 [Alligator mississippiensis]|uniref:Uncharacterized protein n=1 Tax=Alligator mississippiensis TaxID=8496 RepID=A0A151P1A9_ALLMI|nr:hypothetical protein Y1Q_0012950 [Alligator mississippiensis]
MLHLANLLQVLRSHQEMQPESRRQISQAGGTGGRWSPAIPSSAVLPGPAPDAAPWSFSTIWSLHRRRVRAGSQARAQTTGGSRTTGTRRHLLGAPGTPPGLALLAAAVAPTTHPAGRAAQTQEGASS